MELSFLEIQELSLENEYLENPMPGCREEYSKPVESPEKAALGEDASIGETGEDPIRKEMLDKPGKSC